MALTLRAPDVDRFTAGDCHIFARAVQKLTGWELASLSSSWNKLDIHAFILTPTGDPFDVFGPQKMQSFKKKWKRLSSREMVGWTTTTWAEMRRDFGGPTYGRYSYSRARELAPRVLTAYGYM